MKTLMHGAWLLVAVGLLVGCGDTPEVSSPDPSGDEAASPPRGGAQAVDIPAVARVIEDRTLGRFLLSASESSRPYVLGLAVSCTGGAAVREGSRIRCQGDAAQPQVTYLYIPLEGDAGQQEDAAILGAPAVTLTPLKEGGSVQCQGAPGAEFQRLMERYARDLGATVSQSSNLPVAVLLEYQGQRAYGAVPAGPLGLTRGEVSATLLAPVAESGGVSCRCNTTGSCPKDGQWPATWCDASNCKSCTMNY